MRVHDASLECKTAENLLEVLEDVFNEVQMVWQATVVAVVTDASGKSLKAWCLFVQKYPWIIIIDCYSHQVFLFLVLFVHSSIFWWQINLVVGTYFKEKSGVLLDVNRAVDLITWLQSKTLLLALIRDHYAENNKGKTKSVLRAVLTQ